MAKKHSDPYGRIDVRKFKGIRYLGKGYQTYVRINTVLYTETWSADTDVDTMRTWLEDQHAIHGSDKSAAGTFAADVDAYLKRVAAMPSIRHRSRDLRLWVSVLGKDRSRLSIQTADVDTAMQAWILADVAPGTIKNRRAALRAFFYKVDPKRANPVRGSQFPKQRKPEARNLPMATIERIVDTMATDYYNHGIRVPALARIRARVIAFTGLPPALLQQITAADLMPAPNAPTWIRVPARSKGDGVEARELPLTAKGSAAFRAFHDANAYGTFDGSALNEAVKRGAKRIGITSGFRLYDLRHSFLTELYRQTKDLATVARFAMHAEGSPLTARYAQGANQDVDRAAVAAFDTAMATPPPAPAKPVLVRKTAKTAAKRTAA